MNRQGFVDRLRNLAVVQTTCLVSPRLVSPCLVLSCLALCSLAPAASAQAASDGAFKTASGNIVCGLSDVDVECVIKSGLIPAPPKKRVCNGGDPVTNRVSLSATGTAAPMSCAGDPGPLADEAEAKELAEGATMIKGEIGCVAFKFGLVCANSKGRGVFLSRASVRYF